MREQHVPKTEQCRKTVPQRECDWRGIKAMKEVMMLNYETKVKIACYTTHSGNEIYLKNNLQ